VKNFRSIKVLTIAPWYPSEKDKMAGLFVENFVEETTRLGAVHEVFSETSLVGILRGLIHYSKKNNRPEIVHLHVATKQGLIPLFLKRVYGIPYIATEHWSGYYPENGSFMNQVSRPVIGKVHLRFVKRVFKSASVVTGVSRQLLERVKVLRLVEGGEVLYNIVPEFFANITETHGKETHGSASLQFINVSCFDNAAKNLTGIIDAIKIIREREFTFTFIGDGKDKEMVMEYARSQGVDNKISFTGEVEPREVARRMREASCLVLNSNYETACVVLQEALATGLPIISTPVGIAPEFENHIEIVETGKAEMLANAMARFIDNPKSHYEGITDFKQIPEKLYSIYETLLSGR